MQHKTQTNKTEQNKQNPPTMEGKEFKLPGGDINHEPSIHLK